MRRRYLATETGAVEVVERVAGSSSTDFWGVAHVPSQIEHVPLSTDELERPGMSAGWRSRPCPFAGPFGHPVEIQGV